MFDPFTEINNAELFDALSAQKLCQRKLVQLYKSEASLPETEDRRSALIEIRRLQPINRRIIQHLATPNKHKTTQVKQFRQMLNRFIIF